MPGPLHGFRVVDLTSNVSGPLGTMILGDQGADVIKVEAPDGDSTRAGANRRGGFAASFLNNNRNKRSIVLNLKDPGALAVLMRLVATADVFIQNFRPGVAERIGVGEERVRAARPDIVYVSISGFGEKGPFAQRPVYDPLIQGFTGLATVQGGSDEARPRLLRTILPDKLTAITSSQAITAALLARERTGEGQHVRLSMLEAIVAFLWSSDMAGQTFVGDEPARQEAASSTDLIYETADGYITAAVVTNRQWEGPGARPRTAAMARRRALQDAGRARRKRRGAAPDYPGRADRAQVGRMARPPDQGRRPVRSRADPHRDDPPPACPGDGDRRGGRAPGGGQAAAEPGGGALLRDPDQHPPRRAGTRRAHAGGPRRTGLFGRRDRRVAGEGCIGRSERRWQRALTR